MILPVVEGVLRSGTELWVVREREVRKDEKLEWASWLQCGRTCRSRRRRTRRKEDVWEESEEEAENEMESRSTRIPLLSV